MANKEYISQIKLPDNKTYYVKDSDATTEISSIKTNYVKKTDTIDKAKQLETAVTIQVGEAEQSFDGSEDISFDTADMGIVGNDIKPVASKTYSGIIGSSSNNAANDSFYFMSVIPDDFYTQWKLYYKITAIVPGHNEYHATSYVILHGYGQAAIPSYRIFNIIYSSSYRPYYFHNFYRLTANGFNAGYGNAVGVGLRASNARNTAGYERTITIDLLKTEGCTASFLPNAIKWANWPNNTSTYYAGLTEFNGCDNGLRETGVANANTYDRRYMGGTRLLAGGVGIFAYSLVMQTSDGTWQSLTTTGGNGTAKAVNPVGFLPNSIYWHYYSAIATGSLSTNNYLYETMASGDLTYTFNCGKTLTTNRSVYLVGTMDNGLFYVDPSMYSQELPSSNDGKYYIYLGEATSNYQMTLSALHPIYHYKDGKIVTGITSSSDVTEALGFTPVNKAGDTMIGNLIIENTDPILNIKNTGTGNSQIVLERAGSSAADWKIINNSGLLKFQNNYTTQQTTFFDVLSLAFNTGNAVFKGSVQASSFSGNASSATKFNSNRTISLSGDITGSASSNGESGWSITNAVIGNSKVKNDMLAGSIENGKLINSKVTIAGNDVSLGGELSADTLRTSLGLSSAMHFIGVSTVAITDGGTEDPTISGYSTKSAGDVIISSDNNYEYVWNGSAWELLGGDSSYKTIQVTVTSPSASGNDISFIDTISQDSNGVITATKKTVRDASTTESGVISIGDQSLKGNKTLDGYINQKYALATSKMTVSAAKITELTAAPMGGLFGDGVAFTSPATKNDAAWIRMLGTSENDSVLEIATGDDGGNATSGEQIVVRQYKSSGNAVVNELKLLDKSGNTTIPGTLILSKAIDLSGTANSSPALIVGGIATAAHMEIDSNEIQAKTNGTSVAELYLNNDGGKVHIGNQVLVDGGSVTATTFTGDLSGNATSAISATTADSLAPILLTNENLNDFKPNNTTWYYAGGGNSVVNNASSSKAFGMVVFRSADGYRSQVMHTQENKFYSRLWNNSTWSTWKEWVLTDTHNTAYIYAGASNGSANAATTSGNTHLIIKDGSNVSSRVKITGGEATSVTSDASGTITISSVNTWTAMVGATSSANGSVGYVNAVPPKDGYNTKYLRADGTWTQPPNDNTHNTAYLYAGTSTGNANAATTNGNTYLIIKDGSSVSSRNKITGSGATTVTSDANGVITISSTNTTALGSMTGTLGVSHGGTGATTFESGSVLIGAGTGAVTTKPIDTTSGGTSESASLITSGAVYSGLAGKSDSTHTHKYAGSDSVGGAANALKGFKITTTTSLGIDSTDVNQAIGYVSGLTKAEWNSQQSDGVLYRQVYNANQIHQIFGDYRTGQIAVRGKVPSGWTEWRKVLDSGNYSSFLDDKYLKLTGGTVNGSITANDLNAANLIINGTARFNGTVYGNLTGDVTGNASTATTASALSLVATNEIRFNAASKPSSAVTLHFGYKWSDGSSDALINRYRFDNGAGGKAEVEASTFYGSLSGIATSATILKAIDKDGAAQSGSTNRPITANNVYHDGGLRYYLATSSMATGKPDGPGHIIHLPWDSGNWDAQIALLSSGSLQIRTQGNSANWDGREWITILDANNFSDYTWPKFNIGIATSGSGRYAKIKINSTNNWMLAFTIHLYSSYHHKDIRVSGYNYTTTKKWESPKATLIDSDDDTTIVVSFGYEGNNDLWVAIPVGNYAGVSITDVVNGYTQLTQDEINNLFTLTIESAKPGTLQTDTTAYPPFKSNQTIAVANGGTGATTADGARTNLGLGSIATYGAATAGTKDTWGLVPVIGASDGVMEVGKYINFHTTDGNTADYDARINATTSGFSVLNSDKQTGTITANISGASMAASSYISVNSGNSGTAGGLALYGFDPTRYGIAMRSVSANGGHGYIQGDWATYNYMYKTNSHPTRGWIFKDSYANSNIASISTSGEAVFNGSVTVGGNAENNSGCRMEYISETNSMNFVFN